MKDFFFTLQNIIIRIFIPHIFSDIYIAKYTQTCINIFMHSLKNIICTKSKNTFLIICFGYYFYFFLRFFFCIYKNLFAIISCIISEIGFTQQIFINISRHQCEIFFFGNKMDIHQCPLCPVSHR